MKSLQYTGITIIMQRITVTTITTILLLLLFTTTDTHLLSTPITLSNAQLPTAYDGFSDAEELAVGTTPQWKKHYRDTYYANYDYFTPLTLTGFLSAPTYLSVNQSVDDVSTTSTLRVVGVADQLSISPLLTGSSSLHDDAIRLGLEPGLSGDAASGERARALNAFRSRGVLIPIGAQDLIDMSEECASNLPSWNLTSTSPHGPSNSIKLGSLYKTLARLLASGPNKPTTATADPLANILSKLKRFNNGNTAGDAVPQDGADALTMPLSLVIMESTSAAEVHFDLHADTSTGDTSLLDYIQSDADAGTVGISCLLAQIRFSDPPLYSFGTDGIVAQAISSISVADGSFTSLAYRKTSNSSSTMASSSRRSAQKVIQELARIDAFGFHTQVQSVSYFKTRNSAVVDVGSSGVVCGEGLDAEVTNSLFCQLFASSSSSSNVVDEYVSNAAANFNDLVSKSIFNLREVFGHEGYGNAMYGKSTSASIRPAFVQESKASMYMSSNAPVQEEVALGVLSSSNKENAESSGNSAAAVSTDKRDDEPSQLLGATIVQDEDIPQQKESTSTFPSTPSCLDQSTPTCSPQGGLNIWATTYLPPPLPSLPSDTADEASEYMDTNQMPANGSIAVLVPISSGGMFHDGGIPGASSVAPDVAAVLAAIHSLSSSNGIFTTLLQNTSLNNNNSEGAPPLGQMYFFFLTGEEYGFMGSGRLVKEMESFTCKSNTSNGRAERQQKMGNNTETSSSRDAGVDCGFPFYWFTNFTSLDLDRFDHFISLEGILDSHSLNDEDGGATVPFYAYTDSRLSAAASSPNQQLVNEILSSISNLGQRHRSNNSNNNNTKFNLTIVDFNKEVGIKEKEVEEDGSVLMYDNASFQLLAKQKMVLPPQQQQSGDCSGNGAGGTTMNVSIRTSIPPCSLWPLMASRSLASISVTELLLQAEAAAEGNTSTISPLPPQWRTKSFTLITSRPPQLFIPTTTTPTSQNDHLETAYPLISGTLDTAANLLAPPLPSSSSTDEEDTSTVVVKARFDKVISITHAGSEILSTLLTALATSANNKKSDITTATNAVGSDSVDALQSVEWDEVGRLWYCLAVDINCDPTTTKAPPPIQSTQQPTAGIPPNYYAGVFSYRWSIPQVQTFMSSYISLRLTPAVVVAGPSSSQAVDECVSDEDCGNYYQTCQPTRRTSSGGDVAPLLLSCQYLRVQYTHSFSPAADYDALYPTLGRYVFDSSWIGTDSFEWGKKTSGTTTPNECYWANTLQLFDKSNAVVTGHLMMVTAGTSKLSQQQHVVAVESFWGGDGIGVRSGAYLPKLSHYLSLTGGLLILVTSLVAGVIAIKLDWIRHRYRSP